MENTVQVPKSLAKQNYGDLSRYMSLGKCNSDNSLSMNNNLKDIQIQDVLEKQRSESFLKKLGCSKELQRSSEEDEMERAASKRLSRLYKDIVDDLPYQPSAIYLSASVVFLNDSEVFDSVHQSYLSMFGNDPQPSGLRIEQYLDHQQTRAFRELHRMMSFSFSESDEEDTKDLRQGCRKVYWKLMDQLQDKAGDLNDIVLSKNERSPAFRKLTKMNRIFVSAYLQYGYIMIMTLKRIDEKYAELYSNNSSLQVVDDDEIIFPFEEIPYVKDVLSSENLLNIALMFTDDHPEKLLNTAEEGVYRQLLKEYGKTKSAYDLVRKLDLRGTGSGWGMVYASFLGISEIDSILKSVILKKSDIQTMAFIASLGILDLNENEPDKLMGEYIYIFALRQYRENKLGSKKSKNKSAVQSTSSEVEILKARLAEEQEKTKRLEREKQDLESTVSRLRCEYKEGLEKDNLALERKEKKLKSEIKALKRANQKLKANNETKRQEEINPVVTVVSEGEPIIVKGSEEEYWPNEQRELVMAVLEDSLSSLPENSRRKIMVQDILNHNEYCHTARKKREELKSIFKGFRRVNAGMEKRLRDMGFTVTYEQKRTHGRMVYMDDNRYGFTLTSSGSDHRNGVIKSTEIGSLLF